MPVALRPNQAVTLEGDAEFLGYVVGRMVDDAGQPTGETMIAISKPGATGLAGNRPIETHRLLAAGARPNSAPAASNGGRGPQRRRANLHTAPGGTP